MNALLIKRSVDYMQISIQAVAMLSWQVDLVLNNIAFITAQISFITAQIGYHCNLK
jgi:hypothetical protein